jgi:hypothetical protein
MKFRLAWNWQFSCLRLPSAGITGASYHVWLKASFNVVSKVGKLTQGPAKVNHWCLTVDVKASLKSLDLEHTQV